ncbi:unnamed protein product, partial [Polarella glacialis]
AIDRLTRAVVCCDEDEALQALAEGSGLGRKERETGYTTLHYACQYGLSRLAAKLLDEGASLQAPTRDLILQNTVVQPGGQTPLHLAGRAGEVEIVELLLSRRADPSKVDVDGFTPAAAALQHKHQALASKLAAAAGQVLPSEEQLKSMAALGAEEGRKRAAQQLEVPDSLRHVYTLEKVWTREECERVLASVNEAAASGAASSLAAGGRTTSE